MIQLNYLATSTIHQILIWDKPPWWCDIETTFWLLPLHFLYWSFVSGSHSTGIISINTLGCENHETLRGIRFFGHRTNDMEPFSALLTLSGCAALMFRLMLQWTSFWTIGRVPSDSRCPDLCGVIEINLTIYSFQCTLNWSRYCSFSPDLEELWWQGSTKSTLACR